MTTPKQVEARRNNALQSTGPKTAAGKARSSQNALRHGLRSEQPVVPGESPDAWVAHRDGIRRDLAPAGTLEAELADRVALCLWRLRRVARYETGVTAAGLQEIEESLPRVKRSNPAGGPPVRVDPCDLVDSALDGMREEQQAGERILHLLGRLPDVEDDERVSGDDAFGVFEDLWKALPEGTPRAHHAYGPLLASLGVPRQERDAPYGWDGWTAGMVRRGAGEIARQGNTTLVQLLPRAVRNRQAAQESRAREIPGAQAAVEGVRQEARAREDRRRLRGMLPDPKVLETIARYESHISRQMLQALHTLERLRADRQGEPVPLPAAIDVTVAGQPPAPVAAALEYRGDRES
jgi:hypothetical protein